MRASIASLRMFAVVAETGSLRAAAERLGRTPSSISEQLKLLEDEVGTPLFESGRKHRLTAVGAFVQAQARDLLNHHERTLAAISAFARNAIGRVDIASVPSVATAILPGAIMRFHERWPAVEITVRDDDSVSVADMVQSGRIELGLASLREPRRALAFEPLFDEKLGIVCRHDDPLFAARRPHGWGALEGRTLLANAIAAMPGHAARPGTAPLVVYNVLSLIALVRAGVGITILPRLSVTVAAQEIGFVPIEDPDAIRTVGVLTRAGESLSPAAATFLQLARDELAERAQRFGLVLRYPHPVPARRAGPRG